MAVVGDPLAKADRERSSMRFYTAGEVTMGTMGDPWTVRCNDVRAQSAKASQ